MNPFTAMMIANGFNGEMRDGAKISMMQRVQFGMMTGENLNDAVTSALKHKIVGKAINKENPLDALVEMNMLGYMVPGVFGGYCDFNSSQSVSTPPQPSPDSSVRMRQHAAECVEQTYRNFMRKLNPDLRNAISIINCKNKEEHLIKLFRLKGMIKLADELQASLDHDDHIMRAIIVDGVKSAYIELMECVFAFSNNNTPNDRCDAKDAKFRSMDDDFANKIREYRNNNLDNRLPDNTDINTIDAATFNGI
jgi:hypothetical protein